jgi:hypothetical protein
MGLRRVLAVGVVAVGCMGIGLGAPAAQATPAACVAVSVVNYAPQSAQAILKKHGCLPGKAKDGRHYVVQPQCVHGNQVGLIVNQNPVGKRLGRHQSLTLWQGVSTMATDPGCASMWAQPNAFDGYYIGTFTVTASTDLATYPLGTQIGNLSFTVANGQMTGSVTGAVVHGTSTDAQISVLGVQCPVGASGLTFAQGGPVQASGVRCQGAFGTVTGGFVAGAFFGPR